MTGRLGPGVRTGSILHYFGLAMVAACILPFMHVVISIYADLFGNVVRAIGEHTADGSVPSVLLILIYGLCAIATGLLYAFGSATAAADPFRWIRPEPPQFSCLLEEAAWWAPWILLPFALAVTSLVTDRWLQQGRQHKLDEANTNVDEYEDFAVIGIVGRAGHGKDSVGSILESERSLVRDAFAAPLKDAARAMWLFSGDQLYGGLKNAVDPRWGISPRQAMQYLGTEIGRVLFAKLMPEIGDTFWLHHLMLRVQEHKATGMYRGVVVCDVRFQNEAAKIRELGGKLVRVIRPIATHPPPPPPPPLPLPASPPSPATIVPLAAAPQTDSSGPIVRATVGSMGSMGSTSVEEGSASVGGDGKSSLVGDTKEEKSIPVDLHNAPFLGRGNCPTCGAEIETDDESDDGSEATVSAAVSEAARAAAHASETEQESIVVDVIVNNDGTLDDLRDRVMANVLPLLRRPKHPPTKTRKAN
jgi:hypothetical protein